jgi:PAS domain S-box-containing protein
MTPSSPNRIDFSTARKRAGEVFWESEATLRDYPENASEFRLLVDTIPALVWSAGPEGDIEYVNKRVLEYFGAPLGEIVGWGWAERVHPDDVAFKTKTWLANLEPRTAHDAVCRFRGADGQYRWFEVSGAPLKTGDGRVLRWFGVLIDIDDRRKAEEALRENEYKLRQTIDPVPGLTWSTGSDRSEGKKVEVQPGFLAQVRAILNVLPAYTWYAPPSGSLAFVSKRQADFLGVPEDHPLRFGVDIGAPWDAHIPFLHPDDQEKGREYWSNSLRTGEGYEYDYRVRDAQGNYRWLLTRTEPLKASDGTILLWVGATLDIEELKRADEGLRGSEAKFRDYAETASDWFWEIGPDYKFTLLTENAFGSDSADRIGTACWDHALDLETEPEKWRLIQATLDSRQPFRDFVYRSARRNDSPIHVRASGKPVFDANGEFRGYRGTGTDVTALMRAQEELRESERSARSAIDGIAGLVAIMTPSGEVETVNRQCIEYFGRPLEEQKDWVTTDMVHPEDLPHMLEVFTRAIASEIPYHFEQRLRRFDGEYRWFDTRGGAVRDDAGRVLRWYVLLTDIEDRKRALARLDQMQSDFAHINRVSMLGELVASLSHEITQPIASARNNARAATHFLERSAPDFGQVKEALACVVDDADRAGEILDRIRDHIKKAPPRMDRVDLNQAINDVIVLAQGAIVKNGVSVQTRLAEGLFHVQADCVQLQQVILNLILNAAEAMGSVRQGARELSIGSQPHQAGGVLVTVRDSGPGINPEHLDRVFDTFYTTKSSGVGMGLSICRSIIDAHGGRLWAEANEPRGAVFQFTLPGAGKELKSSRPAAHQTGEPSGGTELDAPR